MAADPRAWLGGCSATAAHLAIGKFADDPKLLRAAADYLEDRS